MSIHNLPPLITQTPEQNQSGFEYSDLKGRLAEASIERALYASEAVPAQLSYFPTHENLRYQINEIHTVVMPRIAEELQEISDRMKLIDNELVCQAEKQQILQETREDLGMFEQSILPRGDKEDDHLTLALRQARVELDAEHENVRARQAAIIRELEKLEEQDFELLQKGL